jgi:hypothetical protein
MKRSAVAFGITMIAVAMLAMSCSLDPSPIPGGGTLDPTPIPGGGGSLPTSVTVSVPSEYLSAMKRMVVDVMLGEAVQNTREYVDPTPPFTFNYEGKFDLVVARGYNASGSLLFTAKGGTNENGVVSIALNYVGVGSAGHIVIFQDGLPWGSTALTDMLALESITEGTGTDQYEIITSAAIAAFTLDPTKDLLIIANDQSQAFYDTIAANNNAILTFVASGGTIFWEAADNGWAGGSIAAAGITLPGGVGLVASFESYNIIAVPDHPIFKGITVEPLYGSSASHEYFTNLPADALVLMTGQDNGEPTLITYPHGAGLVFMTGQPLEFHYANQQAMAVVLPGLVKMILGKL